MDFQAAAKQAQAQGDADAAGYQQQANNYSNQFNQYRTQADSANSDLQNYNKNMVDPSTLYQNALTNAQGSMGFDPKSLSTATTNLTQSQNALLGLNEAASRGVGGVGLTGAQLGQYYSQNSAPLQGVIGQQNNAVQNLGNLYNTSLTQANQQAGLGFQGQQLKSANYNQVYQNALAQSDQASKNMQYYQTLYQNQGQLTSQEVQGYLGAYNAKVTAEAAAQQAYAATVAANASAANNYAQADQTRYNTQTTKDKAAAAQAAQAQRDQQMANDKLPNQYKGSVAPEENNDPGFLGLNKLFGALGSIKV